MSEALHVSPSPRTGSESPARAGSTTASSSLQRSLRTMSFDEGASAVTPLDAPVQRKLAGGAGRDAVQRRVVQRDGTKNTFAHEDDTSGWGFELSDDDDSKSIKISKTLAKKEKELGVGLLHGKLTASGSVFGQGVRKDDGTITGTVGPEVKATAGLELGVKGFNVSLSGQVTASADFWTVSRSPDGAWTVAGVKPISISIGLVGEATIGSKKWACEPGGSYEVGIFDPSVPALYPGKDLERLQGDVEAIVGKLPQAARTAGGMVPPEFGGGVPIRTDQTPFPDWMTPPELYPRMEETEGNKMDSDQAQTGSDQAWRSNPYHQQAVAQGHQDAREAERQAEITQWRPAVAAAKNAALMAAGWYNYAQSQGKSVSPEADALAGQAYTKKALLEQETDQFEESCRDSGYEPKMIGVHAQKRISEWNEIKELFDRGQAAQHG